MTLRRQKITLLLGFLVFRPACGAESPLALDLVRQFERLAHHGDPLGFHRGAASDADNCRHYQGVARLDAADGTPYFYVTRSGNDPGHPFCWFGDDCGADNCPGELLVVRFGSRPRHGERLRSNRLARGRSFEDTPPPPADAAVRSIRFNGVAGWPRYMHPGGFQVLDEVLCIPLSDPMGAGSPSLLCFVDVREREAPQVLKNFNFSRVLGVVGAGKHPSSGQSLFVVSGEDTDVLDFYAGGEDIRSPAFGLDYIGTWENPLPCVWRPPPECSMPLPPVWLKWQNINLLQQADGASFLACSANDGVGNFGNDWVRLFELDLAPGSISLTLRAERHLYLDEPSMGDTNAGGAFHVSPGGQLLFYVTEHDNDGEEGSIKMGEFRGYDVVGSCGGWVEFYEDEDGWDNNVTPDRSVMLDVADYALEDWQDLEMLGFGDDIESIRWSLPPGTQVVCFRHAGFHGDGLTLTGSGFLPRVPGGLDDEISSIQVVQGPDPYTLLVCPPDEGGCGAHTVEEGLALLRACEQGGTLRLRAGLYPEVLTVSQRVTIAAERGTAVIGAVVR
jgi:hypothetical protein